jgi:hypothetical protein
MRISKLSIWLSVLVASLVLIASSTGIVVKSLYAHETFSWAAQGIGQDIANMFIAVPALFIAVYFVNKGSVRAYLIWSGILIYLIYSYIIYAFDIHFNSLFFVYVAILGLSFYTLVGSMMGLNLDSFQRSFSANTKAKPVSVFLLLVAFLWLSEDIPALVTGKIPQTIAESGLPTNPVHVLDFAFTLPGMFLTAILLWRKNRVGYLFAIPLLVFSIMTGALILVLFLVMSMEGLPTSFVAEMIYVIIILVSLLLSVLFLREVKES